MPKANGPAEKVVLKKKAVCPEGVFSSEVPHVNVLIDSVVWQELQTEVILFICENLGLVYCYCCST